MTPELQAEWQKVRRAFVHDTGDPKRASVLLVGAALSFAEENGVPVDRLRDLLAKSGVRLEP